jgi:hypothetical protein
MRLKARGLCNTCEMRTPRGGDSLQHRRVETPEELARAGRHGERFAREILPAVERAARRAFRKIHVREEREDAVAEARGLAWRHFVRLLADGFDPFGQVGCIAKFAVRRVRAWQGVAGPRSPVCVLSERVEMTKRVKARRKGEWRELADAGAWPSIPARVALALDLAEWLEAFPAGVQAVLEDLARGYTAAEAARRSGLSPHEVRQLRQECLADWLDFRG